jgi:hypothetical protein
MGRFVHAEKLPALVWSTLLAYSGVVSYHGYARLLDRNHWCAAEAWGLRASLAEAEA